MDETPKRTVSVRLSVREMHYAKTVRDRPMVFRSLTGMWREDFDWYNFRNPAPILTPQNESQDSDGTVVDRTKLCT